LALFGKQTSGGALLTWQNLVWVLSPNYPWEGSWRGVEFGFGLKLPTSENEENREEEFEGGARKLRSDCERGR